MVERAVILTRGDLIEVEHLPSDLLQAPSPPLHESVGLTAGMRVNEVELRLIELTLEHTGNNKTRAAEILGISVKTLHNKLNRFRAADSESFGLEHTSSS